MTVADLIGTPDWYPLRIDIDSWMATFVPMSPESYRETSFLDRRIRKAPGSSYDVSVCDILPLLSAQTAPRYIFHAAFCGSTLLARCIEQVPGITVLKEPFILDQVAMATGMAPADKRADMLAIGQSLIGRSYPNGGTVVKANDLCNNIAGELMENAASRAIFITVALDNFLVSVLKSGYRREWAWRRLVRHRIMLEKLVPNAMQVLNGKGDAHAAAVLWVFNSRVNAALTDYGDRLLTISDEAIFSNPAKATCTVLDHFGLPRPAQPEMKTLIAGTLAQHSKQPELAYNRDSRTAELRAMKKRYAAELKEGRELAEAMNCAGI